jgi:hypothetical protein
LIAKQDVARIGTLETDDHVERGGLAGPVRAEQPHHLALFNLQTDVVHNATAPIMFDEMCAAKRTI